VNVPQAVWIDEQGKIVRSARDGRLDRSLPPHDLKTRTMSPEDQAERLAPARPISMPCAPG